MSSLRAKIVTALVVTGFAIPAAAHAGRERAAEKAALADLEAMNGMALDAAPSVAGERRVTINGAPTIFRRHTEHMSVAQVIDKVAAECKSGSRDTAFGLSAATLEDGRGQERIELERVVKQQAEGGAVASLCIFTPDTDHPEALRRARYTLAYPREDGTTSVTTIVNASSTPLQEMFPVEGDAPGSDLPEVARPEASRRTLTAIVGNNEHAVRVYESTLPVDAQAASYDRAMTKLGYKTTGASADARMYDRAGKSFLVNFRPTAEGSLVALVPFR